MGDTWLAWLIGAPVAGAAAASLFLSLVGRGGGSVTSRGRWEAAALAFASAGLLAAVWVALSAEGGVLFAGVGFDVSPVDRLALFVVNITLLCSLFVAWGGSTRSGKYSCVWSIAVISSLLASAALAQAGIVSVFCLLGAALAGTGGVFSIPISARRDASSMDAADSEKAAARRITGGLKHISLAVAGTALLVVGILLLSRYGLNLENRGLLQLGVGLLSVGMMVRVGVMPFAAAGADLVDAAPGAAISLLGAVTAAVLLVGLTLFLPLEDSTLSGNSTAWLGSVAVLLAGVRALGIRLRLPGGPVVPPDLIAMTIAVPVGWALTGLLSVSPVGGRGALLLAMNIALAVPLLIICARDVTANQAAPIFKVGLAVGAASLLGLPMLGGFAGTLLVAQEVVKMGGFWLALMLLGSILVAARWLAFSRIISPSGITNYELRITNRYEMGLLDINVILVLLLLAAQVVLLLAAPPIGDMLR